MKLILITCLILSFISIVLSAVAIAPKPPGKPGDCYYEEVGPLKLGESKNSKKQCLKITCTEHGLAQLIGCGVIPRPYTDVDLSKPHPKCCPQPIH